MECFTQPNCSNVRLPFDSFCRRFDFIFLLADCQIEIFSFYHYLEESYLNSSLFEEFLTIKPSQSEAPQSTRPWGNHGPLCLHLLGGPESSNTKKKEKNNCQYTSIHNGPIVRIHQKGSPLRKPNWSIKERKVSQHYTTRPFIVRTHYG